MGHFLLDRLLDGLHLAQQLHIAVDVAAPGDFLLDRHLGQGHRGGHLIAGVEHGVFARMVDVDFTFDHRNAAAFGAVVDRKDGAGHGNQAVFGRHVEVTVALFGGVDDHAAAFEVYGGASAAVFDGDFGAFAHFDGRTVGEFDFSATIAAGAQHIPFPNLGAHGNRQVRHRSHVEKLTVDHLDGGQRAGGQEVATEKHRRAGSHHHGGGERQAAEAGEKGGLFFSGRCYRRDRHFPVPHQLDAAAGELLPNPGGGLFDHFGVGLDVADLRGGAVDQAIGGVELLLFAGYVVGHFSFLLRRSGSLWRPGGAPDAGRHRRRSGSSPEFRRSRCSRPLR